MACYIKNANDSVVYTFPPHDAVTGRVNCMEEEGAIRTETSDRLFAPGGAVIGDLKPGTRAITLKGTVIASTGTAVTDELRSMQTAIEVASRSARRLYLTQHPTEFYKISALNSFRVEYLGGCGATVEAEIALADPFRYAYNLGTETDSRTECAKNTATTVSIGYLPATTYPVSPVTTVHCAQGKISACYVRNLTDVHADGTDRVRLAFKYELLDGETLEIDHENGTVKVKDGRFPAAGADMIKWLTAGEFYQLFPGTNSVRYIFTVPAASVATTTINLYHAWRPRWL